MGKHAMARLTAAQEYAGFGRYQHWTLAVVSLVHAADAVELMAISFLLPAAKSLQLDGPRKGWLSASIFLGMLLGGWIGGSTADRRGRKPVMVAALLGDFVFGAASAFAPSFAWMLALRALAAVGVGAVIPVVFAYWSEFLTPRRRERWLIFLAMSWFGGAILSAALAWAIIPSSLDLGPAGGGERLQGWRLYLLVCSLVSVAGASVLLAAADESPRWYFSAGRDADAARVLAGVRRGNHAQDAARPAEAVERRVLALLQGDDAGASRDRNDEDLDDDDVESSSLLPGRRGGGGGGGGGGGAHAYSDEEDEAEDEADAEARRAGTSSLLARTAAVFRGSFLVPSALLSVAWFAHSFSFYGIVSWLPQMLEDFPDKIDVYENTFYVATLQFPGSLLALWAAPRVGSHRVLALSLAGAGLSVYLLILASSSFMAVAMSGGYMALGTAAWNTTVVVTTAEYPTVVRSTAWGVLSALGRLGAVAGTLTFGHLGKTSKAVPLTAVCVASLIASAAMFALERRSHFSAAHAAGRGAAAGSSTVKSH